MSGLDRAPDGVTRKCSNCSRPFRGEGWMDYCAKCHAENERTSPLRDRWACLTCSTTFECGSIICGPQGWKCPNCKSTDLTTADGAHEIPEYHGEIGTKN